MVLVTTGPVVGVVGLVAVTGPGAFAAGAPVVVAITTARTVAGPCPAGDVTPIDRAAAAPETVQTTIRTPAAMVAAVGRLPQPRPALLSLQPAFRDPIAPPTPRGGSDMPLSINQHSGFGSPADSESSVVLRPHLAVGLPFSNSCPVFAVYRDFFHHTPGRTITTRVEWPSLIRRGPHIGEHPFRCTSDRRTTALSDAARSCEVSSTRSNPRRSRSWRRSGFPPYCRVRTMFR